MASIKLALSYVPLVKELNMKTAFPFLWRAGAGVVFQWCSMEERKWKNKIQAWHVNTVGQDCHISSLAPYWLSHSCRSKSRFKTSQVRSAALAKTCQRAIKGPHTHTHTHTHKVKRKGFQEYKPPRVFDDVSLDILALKSMQLLLFLLKFFFFFFFTTWISRHVTWSGDSQYYHSCTL